MQFNIISTILREFQKLHVHEIYDVHAIFKKFCGLHQINHKLNVNISKTLYMKLAYNIYIHKLENEIMKGYKK